MPEVAAQLTRLDARTRARRPGRGCSALGTGSRRAVQDRIHGSHDADLVDLVDVHVVLPTTVVAGTARHVALAAGMTTEVLHVAAGYHGRRPLIRVSLQDWEVRGSLRTKV